MIAVTKADIIPNTTPIMTPMLLDAPSFCPEMSYTILKKPLLPAHVFFIFRLSHFLCVLSFASTPLFELYLRLSLKYQCSVFCITSTSGGLKVAH